MNKKLKLGLISAASSIALGAVIGIANHNAPIEAKAASSVLLMGDFDWFNGIAFSDTDGDGVWTLDYEVESDWVKFKIVVDGEWCGNGVQDSDDDYTNYVISAANDDDNNMAFTYAGFYSLSVDTNNSNKLIATGQVATTSVSLNGGKGGDWVDNPIAKTFTDAGDGSWSLENVELSQGDEFKIVVNDNWCGDDCIDYESGLGSHFNNHDGDGNIIVPYDGTYNFSFAPNIKSNYGVLTITGTLDTADVVLQITFTAAVPEYVDIYLPGDFNSWAEGNNSLMTPNEGRTAFTYTLGGALPKSYKYKVVACYHASGFSYTTYLVSQLGNDNLSTTISLTDDDTTKTIHSGLTLTAENMPLKYAKSGAVVQVTTDARVNESIKLYFVGTLTHWGTTAEYLADCEMTPNEGRTIFQWAIPSNTPIGNSDFQIVAMYANGGQTKASYDYVMWSDNGDNATITLNEETEVYSYTSTTNLSELGAVAFAKDFVSAMETPCSQTEANKKSAISAIWSTWKGRYEGLTDGAKTSYASSNDSDIDHARTLYAYVMAKHELEAWTGAPEVSYIMIDSSIASIDTNTPSIAIASILVVAAIGTGSYFYFRKRKEN